MKHRRFGLFIAALVLVLSSLGVSSAFASNMVSTPAKASGGLSKIKVHYFNDDTGADWWRTYKASVKKTTFRTYTSYDNGHAVKKVSFRKFRSYVQSQAPSTLMSIKWHWKRKSGKRYRYIDKITVSNYDG